METRLAAWVRDTSDGDTADAILRACVHCGFCLATCPTYRLLGDELDSPRGRIYQIKQVLEGAEPTRATQIHLDRCLTCRSCETTCPSGVEYGHLVDIGRGIVAARVQRPWVERIQRWILREGLSRRGLFALALRAGRWLAPVLPRSLRGKMGTSRFVGSWPRRSHPRKVLLLQGCTQPALYPSIDAATARVLDAVAVESVVAARSGCCGAIRQHLDDHAGARSNLRRNIDAWWPHIESNAVEAIVINASGCGVMVKDYAHLLRDDPVYGPKALRVVRITQDLAQFLSRERDGLRDRLQASAGRRAQSATRAARLVAFQAPCTLQHGLKIHGEVEALLVALGAQLTPVADAHLCCGSAGSYSLLQPEISARLRAQKLAALLAHQPRAVLSANVGCMAHLQAASPVAVLHWIEWVDQALASGVAD